MGGLSNEPILDCHVAQTEALHIGDHRLGTSFGGSSSGLVTILVMTLFLLGYFTDTQMTMKRKIIIKQLWNILIEFKLWIVLNKFDLCSNMRFRIDYT